MNLHYLGHSSFVLTFGDTLRILTDYGESTAYGLDSPIHDPGGLVPDIATVSHQHAEHAGGEHLQGRDARLLSGTRILEEGGWEEEPRVVFQENGLRITAIPTYEDPLGGAPDNISFLFDYRGMKVLHLGDCQGLMVSLGASGRDREGQSGAGQAGRDGEEMERGDRDATTRRIQALYPDHYRLVLLPIGYVRDIPEDAAEFAAILEADVIVPMHFWSPGDRDQCLTLLDGRSDAFVRRYDPTLSASPRLNAGTGAMSPGRVPVWALTPGPWEEGSRMITPDGPSIHSAKGPERATGTIGK